MWRQKLHVFRQTQLEDNHANKERKLLFELISSCLPFDWNSQTNTAIRSDAQSILTK